MQRGGIGVVRGDRQRATRERRERDDARRQQAATDTLP
jgi:hypothetical protein